jgi:hypothetical protein
LICKTTDWSYRKVVDGKSLQVVVHPIQRLKAGTAGLLCPPVPTLQLPHSRIHALDVVGKDIVDLDHLPQQLVGLLRDFAAAVCAQDLDHGVVDEFAALLVVLLIEAVPVRQLSLLLRVPAVGGRRGEGVLLVLVQLELERVILKVPLLHHAQHAVALAPAQDEVGPGKPLRTLLLPPHNLLDLLVPGEVIRYFLFLIAVRR